MNLRIKTELPFYFSDFYHPIVCLRQVLWGDDLKLLFLLPVALQITVLGSNQESSLLRCMSNPRTFIFKRLLVFYAKTASTCNLMSVNGPIQSLLSKTTLKVT